ncbi:MAG TPA: HAMP domain-containing sensor histidine kinase, partial [Bryobacteraceae bacterium]|nr:HAMP domain-containing sensor histidine kinase [Bryobacteraceae bacterium]
GVLYIFPVVLVSAVLGRVGAFVVSAICACLKAIFDIPGPPLDVMLRPVFAFAAYVGTGLFITALMRNRRLMAEHLDAIGKERDLRRAVEEQLSLLVESSPAAIITLDATGAVIAANKAAANLFRIPSGQQLSGRRIRRYLPMLADALQVSGPDGFCTDAHCQGRRDDGEIFSAHAWFSSWSAPDGVRLAAIVADASEEMRDREQEAFRQLNRGNRIAAGAVFHEVRNLCAAIGLLSAGFDDAAPERFADGLRRMRTLVSGLERITSVELSWTENDALEDVALPPLLDDLRIIIEPAWRDVDATVHWEIPDAVPEVVGERNGLLQVFLNLAQNSYRAVQHSAAKMMTVSVLPEGRRVKVRFSDTGTGVDDPASLFQPFRSGSGGTGLGLYISRAMVRSYGGDLRFTPQQQPGAAFTIELQAAE